MNQFQQSLLNATSEQRSCTALSITAWAGFVGCLCLTGFTIFQFTLYGHLLFPCMNGLATCIGVLFFSRRGRLDPALWIYAIGTGISLVTAAISEGDVQHHLIFGVVVGQMALIGFTGRPRATALYGLVVIVSIILLTLLFDAGVFHSAEEMAWLDISITLIAFSMLAVSMAIMSLLNQMTITQLKMGNQALQAEVGRRQQAEGQLKTQQMALQSREKWFRKVIDQAPDMFYMFDVNGIVTDVNQAMCDAAEMSRDELIGRNIASFDARWTIERVLGAKYPIETPISLTANLHVPNSDRIVPLELRGTTLLRDDHPCFVVFARDATTRLAGEKALQDSEKRYRTLFNEAPVMIHAVDVNGIIIDVNQRWLQTMGYEQEAVVGQYGGQFFSEESFRRGGEIDFPKFFERGYAHDLDYQMVTKDEEILDVLFSGTVQLDEQGDFAFVLATIKDVTEQKRMREAVQKQDAWFRKVVDNAADNYMVLDMNGHIVDANQTLCRSLGYTRDELLALSIIDIDTILDSKKIGEGSAEMNHDEVNIVIGNHRRKDGTTFPAELSVTTLFDDGIPRFIAFSRDITDRLVAEMELRKSAERFRKLVDSAPYGFFVYDSNGRLINVDTTAHQLLGYADGELLGKHVSEIDLNWSPDSRENHVQYLESGQPITLDTVYRCQDGQTFPAEVQIVALDDNDDNWRYLGLAHDVTAREKMQVEIREKDVWFRNVIDNAGDYYIVSDINGKIIDVNKKICVDTGYIRNELIGRPLGIISTEWDEDAHREQIQALWKSGNSEVSVNQGKRKDGTIMPIEASISVLFDGDEPRVVAFGRDISERIAAEQAVRASEEKYRTLYNQTPVGMYSIDNKGKFVDVNDYWATMIGYTQDELIGQKSFRFLTAESRERAINVELPLFFKQGYAKDVPYQYVTKNGDIIDTLLSGMMRRDEEGNFLSSLATIVDVTDYNKIQAENRKKDLWFRNVIDNAADSYLVFDKHGKIIDFNKMLCDSLGYTPDEMQTLSISDIDVEWSPEKMRERGAQMPTDDQTALVTGQHQRKDGTIFPVEIVVNLLFDDGEPRFVGFARDITGRLQAQKDLIDSERRFRAVFNNMFQFMGIMEPDGTLLEVNDASLMVGGVVLDDVRGKLTWDTFWWSGLPEAQADLKEATKRAAAGEIIRHETNVRTVDGQIITLDFSLKPLFDDEGNIVLLIPEARDITEAKRIEEELRRSAEEKTIMLREIHHRVKNNLQIILSMLNMAIRKGEAEGETQSVAGYRDIFSRVRSMALIHQQLYRESINMNEIDMSTYIRLLIGELTRTYQPYNSGRIITQIDIEQIHMTVEKAITCGMLINDIVSNALKYAFEGGGGTISVSMSQEDGQMRLYVADDGVGLPSHVVFPHKGSTGFHLINLLTRQLAADVTLRTDSGTSYEILFSI